MRSQVSHVPRTNTRVSVYKKSAIRTSGVVANYSCVHFLYVFDCTLFNDAAPNSDHLAPNARLKMRVTGIGILVYS
jgi:hypothetical protein